MGKQVQIGYGLKKEKRKNLKKALTSLGLIDKESEQKAVLKFLRGVYYQNNPPVDLRKGKKKIRTGIFEQLADLPESVLIAHLGEDWNDILNNDTDQEDKSSPKTVLLELLYDALKSTHGIWSPDLEKKKIVMEDSEPVNVPKQSPQSFFATVPMVLPNIDLQVIRASDVKSPMTYRLGDFLKQKSGSRSFSSDMNWIDGTKVSFELLENALTDADMIEEDGETLWLSPWPLYCINLPSGSENAEEGEVRLTESNFVSCIKRMIDEKFPRLRIEDIMQNHSGSTTRPNFTIIIRPEKAKGGALQPSNDRTLFLPSSYDKTGSWPNAVTTPERDRDRLSRPRHERAGKIVDPNRPLVGHRHGRIVKQAAPPTSSSISKRLPGNLAPVQLKRRRPTPPSPSSSRTLLGNLEPVQLERRRPVPSSSSSSKTLSSASSKTLLGDLEPVQLERRRPAPTPDEEVQPLVKRQKFQEAMEYPRISRLKRVAEELRIISSKNKKTKDASFFLNLCQDLIEEIQEIQKSPDFQGTHIVQVHENYFEIVKGFLEDVFLALQSDSGLPKDALLYATKMGAELKDLIAPRTREEADPPHTVKIGAIFIRLIVEYLENLNNDGSESEVHEIGSQYLLEIVTSTLDQTLRFFESTPSSPLGFLPVLQLMSRIVEEIAQQVREKTTYGDMIPILEVATLLDVVIEENEDENGYFQEKLLSEILQPSSDLMDVQGARTNPEDAEEEHEDEVQADSEILPVDVAGILFDEYDLPTEKGKQPVPSTYISRMAKSIFDRIAKIFENNPDMKDELPPILSLLVISSEVFTRLQSPDMRARAVEINPGSVGSFLHILLIVYLHMLQYLGQGNDDQKRDAKSLYELPSWLFGLLQRVVHQAQWTDLDLFVESKTPIHEINYLVDMMLLYQKFAEVPPWSEFRVEKVGSSMLPFYYNVYTFEDFEKNPRLIHQLPNGEEIDALCAEVVADHLSGRMGTKEDGMHQAIRLLQSKGHLYKTLHTLIRSQDDDDDDEANEEEDDSDSSSNETTHTRSNLSSSSSDSSSNSSSSSSSSSGSDSGSSSSSDSDSSSDDDVEMANAPHSESGSESGDVTDNDNDHEMSGISPVGSDANDKLDSSSDDSSDDSDDSNSSSDSSDE